MDDNSLIDIEKQKIPEGKKTVEPLEDKDLEKFDHYTSEEIEKFVISRDDKNLKLGQYSTVLCPDNFSSEVEVKFLADSAVIAVID